MMTEQGLKGTRIPLENLPNTRDLGGLETVDGYEIIPHRLLRSGALISASESDKETLLKTYGLKTVIDFRTDTERNEQPDPEWEGVRYIVNPIAEEETMGIARGKRGLEKLLKITEDADALMMDIYPKLVGDLLSRERYAAFFRYLLAQEEGAVLWHCSAGKDRVGMGTALLLTALGVPEDAIRVDYMRTNTYMQQANERLIARLTTAFHASEEQIARVRIIFDVREAYLDAAFAFIKKEYGSAAEYLHGGLGLTKEELQRLRGMYLRRK